MTGGAGASQSSVPQRGNGPLSIAMTSLYLPSGSKIGAGYAAHRLANAMVALGHQVTMFSPCDVTEDAKYEHVTVPLTGPFSTFKWGIEVGRLALTEFDIYHSHGDDHFRRRRTTPPHIRTLYGSCFSEAWHIRGGKERLRMLALGVTEFLGTLRADRAVAISQNSRRFLPWVSTVIPCGVDLEVFHPGPKADEPTIVFVGTFHRRKRGDLLMAAFAEHVLPGIPGARLWMVCSDAPPAPNVDVLGALTDEALADRYRRAWVFCLPSSYEGFGVPYLEAMASGTAVVATPNPGSREVLRDGTLGTICAPADLGPTLVSLLKDDRRWQHQADASLEHAAAFAWPIVARRYERIYEELIHRQTRR